MKTMYQKKRELLLDIWADLSARCDLCVVPARSNTRQCEAACPTKDDFKTAILSLDDPRNWPGVFPEA
jgi:hypothetical protein